jgi:hypothetical protein
MELFDTSIEWGRVEESLAEVPDNQIAFNEGTLPAENVVVEESNTDPDDITSILG